MCLRLNRKSRLKFKIAKEDIKVYKIVYKYGKCSCKSSVMNYKYKMGEVCPKIRIKPQYNFSGFFDYYEIYINEAYHYFNIGSKALYNEAYYSKNVKRHIAEFIIPKGTRYYDEKTIGLGVAETIIFDKILKKKEIIKLKEILIDNI